MFFTSLGFYSSAYSSEKKDEEGRFITVESIDAATGEIKQKTYDTTVIPDSLKTTGEMTTKPYYPDSNPDIIQSSGNNTKEDIDSWTTVSNVNSYPYRHVTLITVKYVDDINAYTGTGYMVGPVLTAAHMVKGDENSEIENFKIYIKSSSSSPNSANRRYWSTMYYPTSYSYDNYDWAILIMSTNIGAETGWFGIGTASSLTNKYVSISGYPVINKYYQCMATGGNVTSTTTYRFRYNYDTLIGHSGSPVYDSYLTSWGIHTLAPKLFYNASGVRFTSWLSSAILDHIQAGCLKDGYT